LISLTTFAMVPTLSRSVTPIFNSAVFLRHHSDQFILFISVIYSLNALIAATVIGNTTPGKSTVLRRGKRGISVGTSIPFKSSWSLSLSGLLAENPFHPQASASIVLCP